MSDDDGEGRELVTIEDDGILFMYEPDDESDDRRVKAETCIATDYWFELGGEDE